MLSKERACDEGEKRCYDLDMVKNEPVIKLGDFRKESAELLTTLLTDLKDHNKEYSPGAQMGKALGRMLAGVIQDETESENKPDMQKAQANVVLESARGARTGLAELNTKHEKVLQRFGLRLTHEAGEGLKHGLPSGTIVMKIDNIHAFLRYAQSIPAQNNGNGSSETFATLLDVVTNQIARIDFEHQSPEEKSLMENIDALRDSFERITPDIDRTRLQRYAEFKERLEQYLVVERAGLWKVPGKDFGPADWIRDAGPEWLDEKWGAAMKVLKEQEALGDKGVAGELHTHLSMCVEKAREYAREQTATTPRVSNEILEKYKKELGG